jgi:hypothetical protein
MRTSEADRERLAAGVGIFNVVIAFVGTFIAGTPPAADATLREIRGYFVSYRNALLAQIFLIGLGAAALLWFAGALRSYLRRHEDDGGRLSGTMFGAAVAIALMLLVGLFLELGLVYRAAPTVDDGLLRVIFDALTVGGSVFGFPIAVFMIAASLVGLRQGALPRWLSYVGVGGGIVNLAGTTEIFARSGPWAPGGSATFIPFAILGVWEIAVAIVIISRLSRPTQPVAA